MKLEVGKIGREGGETAWQLVGDDGLTNKEFFVQRIGKTPISLCVRMLVGEPLTDDEFALVHEEIKRQNPGVEVVWPHDVIAAKKPSKS